MGFTAQTLLGVIRRTPQGAQLLNEYMPGLVDSPLGIQLNHMPVEMVAGFESGLRGDEARQAEFFERIAAIDPGEAAAEREREVYRAPSTDYEAENVARGSATVDPTTAGRVYEPWELVLHGPEHGNPFVDVDLRATITGPSGQHEVTGFYDGDGVYRLRVLPMATGEWSYTTHSTARSLDGITGTFQVGESAEGAHGPVRVDGFHFRHEDGTAHYPLGTTAYAWTHQPQELQERTLTTLADGPFTKIRMCVFPKSYLFNREDPELYPFVGEPPTGWDYQRFDPAFFRHLEKRIADLGALGIEADLIIFHPYDKWGFSDMDPVADDRYVRYLVARLAAYPNVWWSMANEFDLVRAKSEDDWVRLAQVVRDNDPYGHLLGVHNCMTFWDNSVDWVTHSSTQRVDVYRTAEEVTSWREQWGKPVVVDECAYEGDIDQGWGNITAEEMVRRFWEAAVRGGYCGHGETYWAQDEVLWWSKGGVLKGESPARIAFLRQIHEDAGAPFEPATTDWDVPTAVAGDRVRLTYFSFMRPRYRTFLLPKGQTWRADVIDTWNMTINPVDGVHEGVFRIDLPARQYMAVRLTRVDDPAS